MVIRLNCVLDDGGDPSPALPVSLAEVLRIPLGSDVKLEFLVTNRALVPIDLTAATIVFTAKRRPIDSDVVFQKTATVAPGLGTGFATAALTPADLSPQNLSPGALVYDVWMTQGGVRNQIRPVAALQLLSAVGYP